MANEAPEHDYHLVEPSPWPIVGAFSALIAAVGGVMAMHGGPIWLFLIGMVGLFYVMFVWFKDIVGESQDGLSHTPIVKLGLRYGMVLFIASEVMFFLAWFWAFFDAAFYYDEAIQFARVEHTGAVWPPTAIETFDPWHLPLFNTLLLLLSGTTVTWAHHALIHGDRQGLIQGLWLTVILGGLFTCVQIFEYTIAPFPFGGDGGIYSSSFFMATGFHGFHVFVGTIFLIVCLFRAYANHFTPEKHFGFEAAAWYWHFVDVVWLFLFIGIYVWAR